MDLGEENRVPAFRLNSPPEEQLGELLASPSGNATAEENKASTFIIDKLSTEIFENVLRFVSRLPNSNKWETHIDLSDLLELIAVNSEFASFLKSRFTTLCVSPTKNCTAENEWLEWVDLRGPHIWTNSIDVAHKYILAGGGQSLDTLVVAIPVCLAGREGLADDFVTHCPNVKSLSIAESGQTWAHKFRNQIDKLEVRVGTSMDLPPYIPKLKELNLNLYDVDMPPGFWQTIGCSLEKLVLIGLYDDAAIQMDEIKQHCRGLKSIFLEGCDEEHAVAKVSLLTSYGDQLEYAYLFCMNEGQVKEVIAACPNARFDLVNLRGGFSPAGIDFIAPKLDYMSTIEDPDAGGDDAEWRNVWNKCINIRELYILDAESTKVKHIFSTPKKHLKILRLVFIPNGGVEDADKVMKLCAEGTLCIEELNYYGPEFYGDGPKKFLEANRDTLKSVNLGKRQYESREKLDELLDLLLELPALEELFLNCTMPDDKLKTLQKRGIYWKHDRFETDFPGALYPVPFGTK